jgi:CheY-like chemotaxis protein
MSNQRPERRRHNRLTPKGTVIVRAGTYVLRGRVSNLSRSGVMSRTRTTAPERLLGSQVEIDLRFDGLGKWLECKGRLLRIGANSLALSLDVVPPNFTRIVDDLHAGSDHHDRRLSVVLVESRPERRQEMTQAFRTAGCTVIDVSTPLEAIVRLGEAEFEPDLIAVADSLPSSISDELRRFVDTEHPQAMLVAVGDAASAPEGITHWLSSAPEDLDDRIRDVLGALARG